MAERHTFSRPAGSMGQMAHTAVCRIPLLQRLREALEINRITYCQWKGHWSTERWSVGEGDIDLLVARTDAVRLMGVLAELGFKQGMAPRGRQILGLSSFFGLDREVDRLIHVHLHSQLPLGDDWTLNYQLPLASPVLLSSEAGVFFPVPAPELEFVIFVIRMVLAQSVVGALFRRQQHPSQRRLAEWQYLAARVKPEGVHAALKKYLPSVTGSLFDRAVRSLSPISSAFTRLRVQRQLRRALREYARCTQTAESLDRLMQKSRYVVRRIVGKPALRNRVAAGGAVIAVVGGDGAGKTTAIDDLTTWASRSFDTVRLHLGKPPRSLATLAVAVVRRVAPLQTLLRLRSVCIARDRYRLYRKARRAAAQGRLVLCDRYPMPAIRCMDGPNIRVGEPGERARWVGRLLQRLEKGYYDRILPPDLLIVLRVDPEIAVQRKTDEDSDYVRARSREVWDLNFGDMPARVVDAGRAKSEVLADLRALIWAYL